MSTLRSGLSLLAVASIGLGSVLVMAPAASAAAAVGSCYEYPLGTVGKVASAAPVIGCESPHTAETWVGRCTGSDIRTAVSRQRTLRGSRPRDRARRRL